MKKESKEKLNVILTVIGWIIIAFAVVALIVFILRSGVIPEVE